MNNLNQLEKELASWTPRLPSARLKQQLFTAGASTDAAPITIPWAHFTPALSLVLLVMLFCNLAPKDTGYLAVSNGSNILAGLSSSLLDFCATNTRAERMNNWALPASVTTFDWTKTGHSVTTTDSFPSWKTNIQKL